MEELPKIKLELDIIDAEILYKAVYTAAMINGPNKIILQRILRELRDKITINDNIHVK